MAIVTTYGPRGYVPKYGIDENGKKIELYEGPIQIDPFQQKKWKAQERYNVDFLNISRADEPDFLKEEYGDGSTSYTGTTDEERIVWLIEQMRRLQVAYGLYLQKVQDMAKGEADLSATLGTVLTATATSLIKTNPVAALFLGVPGVLIKFLSGQSAKKIQAFKIEKIREWAAIMAGMEQQYADYEKELKSLQNKKIYSFVGIAFLLAAVYFIRK